MLAQAFGIVAALLSCHPQDPVIEADEVHVDRTLPAPPGLPSVLDADTLDHGLNFTLPITAGEGEVQPMAEEVAGGGSYRTLAADAIDLAVYGTTGSCVSLDKLIELKRAAGRPRDLEAIAELEALLEERG